MKFTMYLCLVPRSETLRTFHLKHLHGVILRYRDNSFYISYIFYNFVIIIVWLKD